MTTTIWDDGNGTSLSHDATGVLTMSNSNFTLHLNAPLKPADWDALLRNLATAGKRHITGIEPLQFTEGDRVTIDYIDDSKSTVRGGPWVTPNGTFYALQYDNDSNMVLIEVNSLTPITDEHKYDNNCLPGPAVDDWCGDPQRQQPQGHVIGFLCSLPSNHDGDHIACDTPHTHDIAIWPNTKKPRGGIILQGELSNHEWAIRLEQAVRINAEQVELGSTLDGWVPSKEETFDGFLAALEEGVQYRIRWTND